MGVTAYGIAGLRDTGSLVYNGFVFDAASDIKVTQEPVFDEAGWTVIYNRIIIRVRAVISCEYGTPDTVGCDYSVEYLRQLLTKPCGHLQFSQKGFGFSLSVNETMGGLRDVDFGPKPQIISWTPIGGNRAAEIEWSVSTCIPYCYELVVRSHGLLTFNFGISWSIDGEGMTSRTISGHYEIAMTRVAMAGPHAGKSRTIVDTADKYWDAIMGTIKTVRGFRRTHNRTLSMNRRRMEFSITDTEIPTNNPYPEGVTQIRAGHNVSWSRAKLLYYRNTIHAQITLRPGLSGFWAWAIFVQIAKQRMRHAKEHASKNWVLIEDLMAEEDLFGLTHSFRVGYRFLSTITDFIGDSGLWRSIGTKWDKWEASLSDSMFNSRGYAKLYHENTTEAVWDICVGGATTVYGDTERPNTWRPRLVTNKLANDYPPKDTSWLEYHPFLIPQREDNVSVQKPLQAPEEVIPDSTDNSHQYPPTSPGDRPLLDVLHKSGLPRYKFIYGGYAERAGYEIPRQSVETIGGRTTHEVRSSFVSRPVGNLAGVPVYRATWLNEYVIEGKPGPILAGTYPVVP